MAVGKEKQCEFYDLLLPILDDFHVVKSSECRTVDGAKQFPFDDAAANKESTVQLWTKMLK